MSLAGISVLNSRLISAREEHSASRRSPRRDLAELAVGYALILLVIWTPRPYQRVLYLIAALFLAVVVWSSFHSFSAMGLRTVNLWRSLWCFGMALVLAAAVVLVSAHRHALHPVGGPLEFLRRYWGYALWAFVQQILYKTSSCGASSLSFRAARMPLPWLRRRSLRPPTCPIPC